MQLSRIIGVGRFWRLRRLRSLRGNWRNRRYWSQFVVLQFFETLTHI
jgi:hypothetical protein